MNNTSDYCNPYQRLTEPMSNCGRNYRAMSSLPENPQVTMAYVPFQICSNTYDSDEALEKGTLFPSLNKPFLGKGGCRK